MTPARLLLGAVLVGPLAVNGFGASATMAAGKNALFIHIGLALAVLTTANPWLRAFCGAAWVSFFANGMHSFLFLGLLGVCAFAVVHGVAARLTMPEWAQVRVAILVAVTFQIAWMAMQATGYDPIFQPVDHTMQPNRQLTMPIIGWFSNTSDLALFLGLALPALGAIHWGLAAIVAAVVLGAIRSTAGLLCVVVWILAGAARIGRVAFGVALATCVLGGAAYMLWRDRAPQEWRPTIWRAAAGIIATRPVVGYGVNALDITAVIDSPVGRWNFLQNEWLQTTLEMGVLGLACAVGYTTALARRCWRQWREECVVAAGMLVIVSCVSIPFHVGPVALLAACYLGRLDQACQHA